MVEQALRWLGATDNALMVMGPSTTIILAFFFGGALTQLLKFPLSQFVGAAWFNWTVRAFAVVSTAIFAHILSVSLPPTLCIGVGICQPIAYKAGLACVRKWWPWLEASPMIGAVVPPPEAVNAAEQRKVDKGI